jgi:hypothetical protein
MNSDLYALRTMVTCTLRPPGIYHFCFGKLSNRCKLLTSSFRLSKSLPFQHRYDFIRLKFNEKNWKAEPFP